MVRQRLAGKLIFLLYTAPVGAALCRERAARRPQDFGFTADMAGAAAQPFRDTRPLLHGQRQLGDCLQYQTALALARSSERVSGAISQVQSSPTIEMPNATIMVLAMPSDSSDMGTR